MNEKLSRRIQKARETGDLEEMVSALLDAAYSLPVMSSRRGEIEGFLGEIEKIDLSSPLKSGQRVLYLLKKADICCCKRDFAGYEEYSRRALAAAVNTGDEVLNGISSAYLLRALLRVGKLDETNELAAVVESKVRNGLSTDFFSIISRMALAEFNLENRNISPAILYFKSADSFAEGKSEFAQERYNANLSLALCHEMRGDFEKALLSLEKCDSIASGESAVEEKLEIVFPLANLLTGQKRYSESISVLEKGISLCGAGMDAKKALFLSQSAINRMCLSSYEEARQDALKAQDIYTKENDIVGYIQSLGLVSASFAAEENFEDAYRVLSFSAAVMRKYGKTEAEEILRRMIRDLRESMGGERFDAMAKEMYLKEKEKLGR